MLVGHTDRVNCVKWIPAAACGSWHGCRLLASGAADNTVKIWAWRGEQQLPQWQCLHTLEGHERPVTSLALIPLPAADGGGGSKGGFLLAATSGGPEMLLWQCEAPPPPSPAPAPPAGPAGPEQLSASFGQGAWALKQRIHVGTQTQLCADLAPLPGAPLGWLLLASGGADNAVRLYVRPPSGGFQLQCKLAGHENWVRSVALAAAAEEGGDEVLLLASASQDRYCRIWRIGGGPSTLGGASALDASGAACGGLAQSISRYAPRPHITVAGEKLWCTSEALLVGHEDWVHSVCWRPQQQQERQQQQEQQEQQQQQQQQQQEQEQEQIPQQQQEEQNGAHAAGAEQQHHSRRPRAPGRGSLCLLSASQDRSMLLWRYDAASGIWLSEASVGDAGATCLGYFGGAFSPDGRSILAHGFTGALHLWREADPGAGAVATWLPRHACGGHFGAVVDACWGADGRCVQTASADQTARMFTDVGGKWCEVARTQVHGHDFSCLAAIPAPQGRTSGGGGAGQAGGEAGGEGCGPVSCMYVSGSEEKVLRVFEAPLAFLDTLDLARGRPPGASAAAAGAVVGAGGAGGARGRALGAAVGALALSNKAVHLGAAAAAGGGGGGGGGGGAFVGEGDYPEGPDMLPRAVPSVTEGPPLEEHLAQNTLWPEIRKLYGHGNDVFAIAASPCGRLLASACRAQSAASASVWVWEVGSWRAVAELPAHGLTVTQLAFSPGGGMLLSGSRDRSFAVWRVAEAATAADSSGGGNPQQQQQQQREWRFDLLARVKAAHSRIIWGVSWSHDERFFATCSRDHTVKLWEVGHEGPARAACCTLPPFRSPVTAVSLAPAHARAGGGSGSYVCAVGLEDGGLQLWDVRCGRSDAGAAAAAGAAAERARLLWAAAPGEGHAAAVRRVAWSPEGVGTAMLASCGEDHSVRVFDVAA